MSSTPTTPESSTGNQGKEKRTRKRQRVSCVECTKRRQKCDRQYPCGLCVSRGVAHLCHWASGPLLRPAPARPPVALGQDNPAALSATVKSLSKRLASLERTIADQGASTSSTLNAPIPDTLMANEPEDEEETSPPAPLQRDIHEAAVALAQLSLAHHGEYVGAGTILCALHRLGSPSNIYLPYSKSTESTNTAESQFANGLNPVQLLAVRGLPTRQVADALLLSFFGECNWRFGIPEKWFRAAYSRMWLALEAFGTYVGTRAEQINVNWLSLLFAMLALVPPATVETEAASREAYFTHALSARRLAEDAFLTSPSFSTSHSAADGTVLGCVASVLISSYVAARGRVSEAWKLVGSAIRAAQAAGMHRDPGWAKWQVMCEEERVLRNRGWWSLVVCDQLYSTVLGRPAMVNSNMMDVPLPTPGFSEDPYDAYRAVLVKLCEIVDQAGIKCTGLQSPPYATVLEMDRRYEEWLHDLPEKFRWFSSPQSIPTSCAERNLNRQRHNLAAWYLACRMNLHRPWLTRSIPPILPPPAGLVGSHSVVINPSREKSITLAMELVRMQCAYSLWATEDSEFSRAFFVFDGAVTLISALAYAPDHPSAKQCVEVVKCAMENLLEVGNTDGHGEIAHRAVTVLGVLQRAGGWTGGGGNEQRQGSTKGGDDNTSSADPLDNSSKVTSANTTSQPGFHASIPFLAPNLPNPSTSSKFSNPTSQPAAEPLHPAEPGEDFASQADREGIWINSSGTGWNGGVTREMDVHTMMPFEMLEGMSWIRLGEVS